MGLVTFISFFVVGFIPLSVYVQYEFLANVPGDSLLQLASILTLGVFIAIGYLKSYIVQSNKWYSIIETVLLGTIAALLAYFARRIS